MSDINRRDSGTDLSRAFRLNKVDGKLMGVCAGLADYFGVDAIIVRLVFAIGTLVGFGSFILIYLAIAMLAD